MNDKLTSVEEFNAKLKELVEKFNDDVVTLVHATQAANGLDWNTDNPLPFADDPNIEHRIDEIVCLGGWVADRVKGINRLHRKSLTKKLRRVLGYTHP